MRIATARFHDNAAAAITERQSDVYATQGRIASGRRVTTAADDPVGAATVVRVRSSLAETERWQAAQSAAKGTLSLLESTLGGVQDVIANARDAVIAGGNATYSTNDRKTLADSLRLALDQLVGLANETDSDGGYLFAGFASRTTPFVQAGTTVAYAGDSGERSAQVGAGALLQVTQAGDDVFMRVPSGNGVFATAADAANTGTGVVNNGRVTDAALVTGHDYQVVFTAPGTYSVFDTTAGTTLVAGAAFTPGTTIAMDGIAFEITGTPAAGDRFTASASTSQSLFERMARAITVLEDPGTGAAASAWRASELGSLVRDFDAALDHVLLRRGEAGNALARLDALATMADDRALAQTAEIAATEDLDYTQAVSQLSKGNLALEAAMAAYAKVGTRNLFDYL